MSILKRKMPLPQFGAGKLVVVLKLDREQNIAGAEYFNGCTVFESDVEAKFKRGMPKAQNVYAQLKAIPRNRTGGAPKK
jgi:hypothetical protein